MIPYELDPSLHTGRPEPQVLEDGFSRPRRRNPEPVSNTAQALPAERADTVAEPAATAADRLFSAKSDL